MRRRCSLWRGLARSPPVPHRRAPRFARRHSTRLRDACALARRRLDLPVDAPSDASFLHARRRLRFSACAPTRRRTRPSSRVRRSAARQHHPAAFRRRRHGDSQARRQGAWMVRQQDQGPAHACSAGARPQRAELHEPCDRGTSWVCPSMNAHCSQATARAACRRRRRLELDPAICPCSRAHARHTLTHQHPARGSIKAGEAG